MQNRTLKDAYMLRLPDGWRASIKATAAQNRRSMNQEILIALGGAFGLATGADFGEATPAAGNDNAALAGGASITNGIGGATDECPNE